MDEVYLEEATKSVIELLQQITEKLNTLESIDKSIDFLAAAMTGMDPLDIEVGQQAYGRLALPVMRNAPQKAEKVDENIHISDRIIEEIMEEEIIAMLEQGESPEEEFTKKAAAKKMSVPDFADHVLANEDDFDKDLIKQAEFAKTTEAAAHSRVEEG
jgi:hypothetical protein